MTTLKRPNSLNDGIPREPAEKCIALWKDGKPWIQRGVQSMAYLEEGFPLFPSKKPITSRALCSGK